MTASPRGEIRNTGANEIPSAYSAYALIRLIYVSRASLCIYIFRSCIGNSNALKVNKNILNRKPQDCAYLLFFSFPDTFTEINFMNRGGRLKQQIYFNSPLPLLRMHRRDSPKGDRRKDTL